MSVSSKDNFVLGISLYRITSRAYFHLPFLVSFFYLKGLSIISIECILAIYCLTILVVNLLQLKKTAERYLNDKNLLIVSELLKIFGLAVLYFADSYLLYAVAQVILGLGYCIGAGSDNKIIQQNAKEISLVQGKTNGYMFLSLLGSGLIGSYLFSIDLYLPFIASIGASLLSIVFCKLFLPDTVKIAEKSKTIKQNESDEQSSKINDFYVYTYSFIRGIALTFFTGLLPYYLFVDLKVGIYLFIGILTSYTLAGSIASKHYGKVNIKGPKLVLFLNIVLIISLILFFIGNVYVTIIGTILLGLTAGPVRPIVIGAIIDFQKNSNKLISKMETIYSIINIILLIIGGILYKIYNFQAVVLFMMCVFIILGFTLIQKYVNIRKEVEKNENQSKHRKQLFS